MTVGKLLSNSRSQFSHSFDEGIKLNRRPTVGDCGLICEVRYRNFIISVSLGQIYQHQKLKVSAAAKS